MRLEVQREKEEEKKLYFYIRIVSRKEKSILVQRT